MMALIEGDYYSTEEFRQRPIILELLEKGSLTRTEEPLQLQRIEMLCVPALSLVVTTMIAKHVVPMIFLRPFKKPCGYYCVPITPLKKYLWCCYVFLLSP